MAATKSKKFGIHLEPLIELVGVPEVIKQIGAARFVREGGLRAVVNKIPLSKLLAELTPDERQELKKLLK